MVDWKQTLSHTESFRHIADDPLAQYHTMWTSKPNCVWQTIQSNWINHIPLYWYHEQNRSNVNITDNEPGERQSETVEDYMVQIHRTGPNARIERLDSEHSTVGNGPYNEDPYNEAEQMIVSGGSSQDTTHLSQISVQENPITSANPEGEYDLFENQTEPKTGEQLIIQPNLTTVNSVFTESEPTSPSENSQLLDAIQLQESRRTPLLNNNSPEIIQTNTDNEVQPLSLEPKLNQKNELTMSKTIATDQGVVINHDNGTIVMPSLTVPGCPNTIEITHTVTLRCLPCDGTYRDGAIWSPQVSPLLDASRQTQKTSEMSGSSKSKKRKSRGLNCLHTAQHVEPPMDQTVYYQSSVDPSLNRSIQDKDRISSKSSEHSQTTVMTDEGYMTQKNSQSSILIRPASGTEGQKSGSLISEPKSAKPKKKKCSCCGSKRKKSPAKPKKREKKSKRRKQAKDSKEKPSYFCFRRRKKPPTKNTQSPVTDGTVVEAQDSRASLSPSPEPGDSQILIVPGDELNEDRNESTKALKLVRFEQNIDNEMKNDEIDPPTVYVADQTQAALFEPQPVDQENPVLSPEIVPVQQPTMPIINKVTESTHEEDSKKSAQPSSPVGCCSRSAKTKDGSSVTPVRSHPQDRTGFPQNPNPQNPSSEFLMNRTNMESQYTMSYPDQMTTNPYSPVQSAPLPTGLFSYPVNSAGLAGAPQPGQPISCNYCACAHMMLPCPYMPAIPAPCLQPYANGSYPNYSLLWMNRPNMCMCQSRMCYTPVNSTRSSSKCRSSGANSRGGNSGGNRCLWSSCCRQRNTDLYKPQMVPCPYYGNQ